MTHEVSITRQDKDGKWRNYASKGANAYKKPLKTRGEDTFDTVGEAESAAGERSRGSNEKQPGLGLPRPKK